MQQTYGDLKRILVPVPLKGKYKAALRQAVFFHLRYGSQITVLNVLREKSFRDRWFRTSRPGQDAGKAMDKLKHRVQKCFSDGSIPEGMEFSVVKGEIISSILKVARKINPDLIIIKKAGRFRGTKPLTKADNANKLIANSLCPVLTIGRKPVLEGIGRILLPVDITKMSEIKVAWAKSMAKRFNAEIHVVSVTGRDIHHLHSYAYQKGRQIVNDIKRDGIRAELVLLKRDKNSLQDVVLDYAGEFRPDLLMIMTHQESILFDNDLGSFAKGIIHRAKMPVLSVVPQRAPDPREKIRVKGKQTGEGITDPM